MELTRAAVDALLDRLVEGKGEAEGEGERHVYLAPDLDPRALTDLLAAVYGTPRTLVLDGFTDPTVDDSKGAALLAPFGDRAVKIRAWADGDRWIGAGTARNAEGVELPVLAVARREGHASPPAARHQAVHWSPGGEVPASLAVAPGEDVDWFRRLVAITGWTRPARRPDVDWAVMEARLGTALPGDYKRMVETFGEGAFDGELSLLQEPWTSFRAEGMLTWAGSDQEDACCWLIDGGDPDRWPVVVRSCDGEDTHFGPGTARFVCHVLVDRLHPYSPARHYDTPWFVPFRQP
jgi:hypothetical protein